MNPSTAAASAKSLFQALKSRNNGHCLRELTLHIKLGEAVPGMPDTNAELTIRCKPSERDDQLGEVVVKVEDKGADHWRRTKEEWEPGSHEWVSCEVLERALSTTTLVSKYRNRKMAQRGNIREGFQRGTVKQRFKPSLVLLEWLQRIDG